MKSLAIRLLAPTLMLLLASQARAGIVFDNLGPGNSYNTGTGWSIGVGYTQGDAFSPSQTVNLSDIQLGLSHAFGPSTSGTVELRTDAGGQPGALLESWSVSITGSFGSQNPLVVVDSVSHPLLQAGQEYWVVAASDPNSDNPWNWNSTGGVGPHAYSTDGGASWSVGPNTQGAFLVEGTTPAAVPEPASLTLLGTGALAGLGYFWRRRRQLLAAA